MTYGADFLTNLAAELAAGLIAHAAGRLRDAAFGDAETRALSRAWEGAFRAMLEAVSADLGPDTCYLLQDVLLMFISAEGVSDALLDLAMEDHDPPLEYLRARFDDLEFDRTTLPADFDVALTALARGLVEALLAEAGQPDSPLYNRVSIVRAAAVHTLLREQRGTLVDVAATVARLEQQLPVAFRYNLVFLGPVSAIAVGDQAAVSALPADLGRLMEEILTRLNVLVPSHRGSPTLDRGTDGVAFPPNPFTDTLAIRESARFVGREGLLTRLDQALLGGSVALVGDRKMGKSSLLYRLAERLRRQGQTVLFWDFFDLTTMPDLLIAWLRQLDASGQTWADFKRAVQGRGVVLLLDELELGPARGFDVDWLRACRSLVQADRSVRFVTASRVLPRVIFPAQDGSWPYDFLVVQPVGPLDPGEAGTLLAHPWSPQAPCFDPGRVEKVIALAGCHPYRLQRAAHHCYEALVDATYDWRGAYRWEMEALGWT